MAWQIKFDNEAKRQFEKLDTQSQRLIQSYLNKRMLSVNNPKIFGKALRHDLKKLWRYRVGKFRIICEVKDKELIVLIIKIGHRADVYE